MGVAGPAPASKLRVIERAVVFCKSVEIGPEHLALTARPSGRPAQPATSSMAPPSPQATALGATMFGATIALPPMPSVPAAPPSSPPVATPPGGTMAFGSGSLPSAVDAFERERIVEALAKCEGNQTAAAEMLGISRRTLLRRLDDFQLPRPRKP